MTDHLKLLLSPFYCSYRSIYSVTDACALADERDIRNTDKNRFKIFNKSETNFCRSF